MPKGHSIVAAKHAQVVRIGTGYAQTPMLFVRGTYSNTGTTGPSGTFVSAEIKDINKERERVSPDDEFNYKYLAANDINTTQGWTGPTGGTANNNLIRPTDISTLTYRQTLETTFCST
jgi:hypothetical protein